MKLIGEGKVKLMDSDGFVDDAYDEIMERRRQRRYNSASEYAMRRGLKFRRILDPSNSRDAGTAQKNGIVFHYPESEFGVEMVDPQGFLKYVKLLDTKVRDADKPLSKMNVNELRELAVSLGANKNKLYGTSAQSLIITINKLRSEKKDSAEVTDARKIRANSVSVGNSIDGEDGEWWKVTYVKRGSSGDVDVKVKSETTGETDSWYFMQEDFVNIRDSAEVTDGKIVGVEGRSMDGIPYGLYQEGGRSYRGFAITSSENGLRKGVYRFYNWGGGVPFGNAAADGQFSEAQFQKLIGEGKVKLLDSVGYFGDAGDFAVAMSESSSQYDGRHRFLGNGGRSWVQGGSDNVDLFNTREEAEKRAKEQLPRYKASVVSAEAAKKPWVRDSVSVSDATNTIMMEWEKGSRWNSKSGFGSFEEAASYAKKLKSDPSYHSIAIQVNGYWFTPEGEARSGKSLKEVMRDSERKEQEGKLNDTAVNCNKFEILAKESGANFHNISNTKKDGVTYMKFVSSAPEAEQERSVKWLRSVLEGQEGSGVLSWGMRGTSRGELSVMIKDAEISHNDAIKGTLYCTHNIDSEDLERKEHEGDLKDSGPRYLVTAIFKKPFNQYSAGDKIERTVEGETEAAKTRAFLSGNYHGYVNVTLRRLGDSRKMFKVVDKATDKTLLVKATDSLAAVQRVSSLKDATKLRYELITLKNGETDSDFVEAGSQEEALTILSGRARGRKLELGVHQNGTYKILKSWKK